MVIHSQDTLWVVQLIRSGHSITAAVTSVFPMASKTIRTRVRHDALVILGKLPE